MPRSGSRTRLRVRSRSGFSLIELLVVIVAMGIAASVAMRAMTEVVDDRKTVATESELDMLARAIVGNPDLTQDGIRSDFGYVGDVGAFPPDLQALYQNAGSYSTWDGPYVQAGIIQDSTGFKFDAWGTAYSYSGGVTIASTGGGSTLTRQVTRATSDYLNNIFSGTILDADGNGPGPVYKDSVAVVVTIPDGAGGTRSKAYRPNASGTFTLDSIPAGKHPLRLIFVPALDTVFRYLVILPRHRDTRTYRFSRDYFSGSQVTYIVLSTTEQSTLGGLTSQNEDLALYDPDADTARTVLDGSSAFSGGADLDAAHLLLNGKILLSTTGPATIGDLTFQYGDLVVYDTVTGTARMLLVGNDVFSAAEDIDAVFMDTQGHILLSTTNTATIGGLTFEDEDIVEYDMVAGTATTVLDGTAIFANNADVNALHVLDNGHFVISTTASETIDTLSFDDEDLVEYDTGTGGVTMYFDGDVPFGDINEEIDAAHIGEARPSVSFAVLRPDAAGDLTNLTHSGCTGNFECVDDTIPNDDATIVIRASSSPATDVYALSDPVDTLGNILSVRVICRARRTRIQGSIEPALYVAATEYRGTDVNLTGSYDNYSHAWTTNPSTGSAWIWSEIIDLQAGMRLEGQSPPWPAYCTQVWVEVAYVH